MTGGQSNPCRQTAQTMNPVVRTAGAYEATREPAGLSHLWTRLESLAVSACRNLKCLLVRAPSELQDPRCGPQQHHGYHSLDVPTLTDSEFPGALLARLRLVTVHRLKMPV